MIKKGINFFKSRLRKVLMDEVWIKDYIENGMKIGENSSIEPGVIIDKSHCWLIEIGNNVTIAPEVYLLAHDASTKKHLDYTKIAKIKIEDNVFIGARALIMPGVTIGKNAIVAAGSIVTKSVPEGMVVGGNPAKVITDTDSYINKHRKSMLVSRVYEHEWTIGGNITKEMRGEMANKLENELGYVK